MQRSLIQLLRVATGAPDRDEGVMGKTDRDDEAGGLAVLAAEGVVERMD